MPVLLSDVQQVSAAISISTGVNNNLRRRRCVDFLHVVVDAANCPDELNDLVDLRVTKPTCLPTGLPIDEIHDNGAIF